MEEHLLPNSAFVQRNKIEGLHSIAYLFDSFIEEPAVQNRSMMMLRFLDEISLCVVFIVHPGPDKMRRRRRRMGRGGGRGYGQCFTSLILMIGSMIDGTQLSLSRTLCVHGRTAVIVQCQLRLSQFVAFYDHTFSPSASPSPFSRLTVERAFSSSICTDKMSLFASSSHPLLHLMQLKHFQFHPQLCRLVRQHISNVQQA